MPFLRAISDFLLGRKGGTERRPARAPGPGDRVSRREPDGGRPPSRPGWHRQTLAALDLETTGLSVLEDRVVQAAFLWVEDDGSIGPGSWHGIVDPGIVIPEEAAAIHGITTEIARTQGEDPKAVFRELGKRVAEAADRGIPVVIYNAPFDWPFLLAEAERHRIEIPGVHIVDPLVCDRTVDRFRRGSRRLAVLTTHLRDT